MKAFSSGFDTFFLGFPRFGLVFPFFSWKARVALDPAKGTRPPRLCFGLCHCCLKRYTARRQLVAADYATWRLKSFSKWTFLIFFGPFEPVLEPMYG